MHIAGLGHQDVRSADSRAGIIDDSDGVDRHFVQEAGNGRVWGAAVYAIPKGGQP